MLHFHIDRQDLWLNKHSVQDSIKKKFQLHRAEEKSYFYKPELLNNKNMKKM
jgi:hypothetical protein